MTIPSVSIDGDTRVTVTWHWPSPKDNKALPVHGNTNRWARQGIVKRWKTAARDMCLEAGVPNWEQATVSFWFYRPNRRTIDQMNHTQRMKSVIDGVVLAGLLPNDNDRHLRVDGVRSEIDKDNPRVEIEFVRDLWKVE